MVLQLDSFGLPAMHTFPMCFIPAMSPQWVQRRMSMQGVQLWECNRYSFVRFSVVAIITSRVEFAKAHMCEFSSFICVNISVFNVFCRHGITSQFSESALYQSMQEE